MYVNAPWAALNARGYRNISSLDLLKAISRKRCKTVGKLVLITNRKSIFAPKSVTLNDLERRNGP